jgi:hypothetical protein
MVSNKDKIDNIIKNNIKYKLYHKDLDNITPTKCTEFKKSGLINIDNNLDYMYEYNKIICVLKGYRRIEKIHPYILSFNKTTMTSVCNLDQLKVLIIASKLKLKIIYMDDPDFYSNKMKVNYTFNGLIFNNNNSLLAQYYYFLYFYKKKEKYIYSSFIHIYIIKEYIDNSSRKTIEHVINKYMITKSKIPKRIQYLFKTIKKKKEGFSYKQNYIDHLNIIKKNKVVMKKYYDDTIGDAMKLFYKYVDSDDFNNFKKNIKIKSLAYDNTALKKIINKVIDSKEDKAVIYKELDKIK